MADLLPEGYILILDPSGEPVEVTHHNEAYACAKACELLAVYTGDIAVYELPSLRHVQTYTQEPEDTRG
jgi:hypothetical protein